MLFIVLRLAFQWENKKKAKQREALRAAGPDEMQSHAQTAFTTGLTDKTNPKCVRRGVVLMAASSMSTKVRGAQRCTMFECAMHL